MDNSNKKEYSLSTIETNYLLSIQDSFQKIMTGYLITVASGRLGHQITNNTQFEFDPNGKKLIIREIEQPKAESAVKTAK